MTLWKCLAQLWTLLQKTRVVDLNDMRLFLKVLEAGKFKMKVLATSVLGKGPLPVLQPTAFSLRGGEGKL